MIEFIVCGGNTIMKMEKGRMEKSRRAIMVWTACRSCSRSAGSSLHFHCNFWQWPPESRVEGTYPDRYLQEEEESGLSYEREWLWILKPWGQSLLQTVVFDGLVFSQHGVTSCLQLTTLLFLPLPQVTEQALHSPTSQWGQSVLLHGFLKAAGLVASEQ